MEAVIVKTLQLQDAESAQALGSAASERLKAPSHRHRRTPKTNRAIVDNFGIKLPQDLQDLVTRHIRKEFKSPRQGAEKAGTLQSIALVWNSSEPRIWDLITPLLFLFGDLNLAPSLARGGDVHWSPKPPPWNSDYPLVIPKTRLTFRYRYHPETQLDLPRPCHSRSSQGSVVLAT